MYKVQPYEDTNHNEYYHLLNCKDFSIVPEAESFFKHAKLRDFSPNTLAAYAYDLMQYYNYCESIGADPLHLNDGRNMMEMFENFTAYLLTRKNGGNVVSIDKPARTNTTVNRIMSTIISYYHYLSFTNLAEIPSIFQTSRMVRNRNFLSELVKCKVQHYNYFIMKTQKRPIKYITREQYDMLLDACHTLRDKIIVSLMYEGGLRCSEVCGIHIEDLCDIEHGIIHIVPRDNNINGARVKNHARGDIVVPRYIINMITEYITNRENDFDYLFITTRGSKKGCPLTRRNVTKLFNALSKRVGLKSVHPHMLRHGYAIEKIEDGWELFEVQSYLRHKNPASTLVYAEFTDQAKIERMQDFYKTHGIDLKLEDFDYVEE